MGFTVGEACDFRESEIIRLLQSRTPAWPLSAQELGARLHTSDRTIRALISHLRTDHFEPICSTPSQGFFYPSKRADAAHTLATFRSRIAEMQAAAAGIEEGLERAFGQAGLFDNMGSTTR